MFHKKANKNHTRPEFPDPFFIIVNYTIYTYDLCIYINQQPVIRLKTFCEHRILFRFRHPSWTYTYICFFFPRDGLGGNRRKDQTPTGDAWPWKWIVAFPTMRHSPENRKERTVRTMGTWCARHSRQTNKIWIEYKYYFNRRKKGKIDREERYRIGLPSGTALLQG